LERDSFVSLTGLKKLVLQTYRLTAIDLGAFNGISKLTALSIWAKEISEIIPGTFENMSSLENLDL